MDMASSSLSAVNKENVDPSNLLRRDQREDHISKELNSGPIVKGKGGPREKKFAALRISEHNGPK